MIVPDEKMHLCLNKAMSKRKTKQLLTELRETGEAAYTRATALLSRGHLALQSGNYATEQDIASMRGKAAGYEFRTFRKAAAL